jgi:hypothetical protein
MTDVLPELRHRDVTILFPWDFYDGPLSGALEWRGRRYWFSALESDSWPPISYEVRDLTEEQWELVDSLNELFKQHVTGAKPTYGLFYDDPRVKAWQDPPGRIVANLRLHDDAEEKGR